MNKQIIDPFSSLSTCWIDVGNAFTANAVYKYKEIKVLVKQFKL